MYQLSNMFHRKSQEQRQEKMGARRRSSSPPRRGASTPNGGRKVSVYVAVFAWLLIPCLASLALPHPASAQVLYGSLTGNITDPTGAVVVGAKVEALNLGTNI